jgi:broad specificity phosphatase PhoE
MPRVGSMTARGRRHESASRVVVLDVGMARETTRLLYLARHAEPDADGAGLTSNGTRQAEHLGRRLAPLSVGRITHGPLPRAAETARVVAEQFEQSPSLSEDEAFHGAALGPRAIDVLAGPAVGGREPVDVVITHAFTIGWLVRHALDAPAWRWFPPSQCHAGLTVIRYEDGGPPSVVVANDVAHLPDDLRWTGFPAYLRL